MTAPRLVDFQVMVGGAGLMIDEERSINLALFASYEPVRLWLKERRLAAPFCKIVIRLDAGPTDADGHVAVALLICEVTECVELEELRREAGSHSWVLAIARRSLARILAAQAWTSDDLGTAIDELAQRSMPLVHVFDRLAKVDRRSRLRCVPWMSFRPGDTRIGVRIGERDVVLASSAEPIWLEDDFPMASAVIRAGEYVLRGRDRAVLARVPIEPSSTADLTVSDLTRSVILRHMKLVETFSRIDEAADEYLQSAPRGEVVGIYRDPTTPNRLLFTTSGIHIISGETTTVVKFSDVVDVDTPSKEDAVGLTVRTRQGDVFVPIGGPLGTGGGLDAFALLMTLRNLLLFASKPRP